MRLTRADGAVYRWLLVALAVLGAALSAVAAVLVLTAHDFLPDSSDTDIWGVFEDAQWITTGLIAWYLRPANRVGPLMIGLGFADMLSRLYWDAALPFTLASLCSGLFLAITVHLFVAFPSGRLGTRFERAFVAFVYGAAIVYPSVSALFWDPRSECPHCPRNLLMANHNTAVSDALDAVGGSLVVAILITLAVLLVRRVRRASGPTRRALAPVLLTAAVGVVALIVEALTVPAGIEAGSGPATWVAGVAFGSIPFAFLVGLLRVRLQRSGVADLVVELGSAPPPARAREAIARTLGDPSLQLAFWLPDNERYVDPNGAALDPYADPGRAVTVLERDGRRVAALVHDPSLLDDPELVGAVGAAATLALENARLQAEVRAQLAEVRASRARIVAAGDAERRRVERDLHDGAQQRLLGIRLALQLARGRVGDPQA